MDWSVPLSYNQSPINNKIMEDKISAKIWPNGPILISGEIKVVYKDGKEEVKKDAHFCRCGHSNNKPFCDGAHKKAGFLDE